MKLGGEKSADLEFRLDPKVSVPSICVNSRIAGLVYGMLKSVPAGASTREVQHLETSPDAVREFGRETLTARADHVGQGGSRTPARVA